MAAPPSKSSPRPSRTPSAQPPAVELKQRALTALSKLSDRDTAHLAAEDLDRLIRTTAPETAPALLTALLHDPPSSPLARRECLRLISLFCSAHPDLAAGHLPKIVAHIVRRIKDPSSDGSVRDACRDAFGSIAAVCGGSVSPVMVRPLLEVLGEQNKGAQAAAAACLARAVDGAAGCPGSAEGFQKLCARVCRILAGQGCLAKGALLGVVSSLARAGAITPQSVPALLQCVRECLENSDWATRKAAGDTLCILASHSSHLIGDNAASIVVALESSRFDKVKPVRDSICEALILWKKLSGSGEREESKDRRSSSSNDLGESIGLLKFNSGTDQADTSVRNVAANPAPLNENIADTKGSVIPEKAVVILKRKAPSLTDKELNPEFFQKLETRISDDLPVEVVVPRRGVEAVLSQGNRGRELNDERFKETIDHKEKLGGGSIDRTKSADVSLNSIVKQKGQTIRREESGGTVKDILSESRTINFRDARARSTDVNEELNSPRNLPTSRVDGLSESFANSKGNWLAIQRQLSLLERQQASLMNMLQDFMGGSHDSMVTLENRVRGLERIVDEMARDLSLSSNRRGNSILGGFTDRFRDHSNGRYPFAERFYSCPDPYTYAGTRRGLESLPSEGRPSRIDNAKDQISSRRAWEKGPGPGPFRLGEGPSARSVWQASKDEATLEAIRVAGPVPEQNGDFGGNADSGGDRGELWASWNRALDSLHAGDVDSAYAEVLSTGDQLLLVKLMDRSGPALDQLGDETAAHVLRAIAQFLLEQGLLDVAFAWVNQLADMVEEEGGCPPGLLKGETKREILVGLHAASSMDPPEEWDGLPPEQMMKRLASAWGLSLQQLFK